MIKIGPNAVEVPERLAILALTFMRARSELTYTVEGSDDLITWSTITANPGTAGETVTVTDTAPTSTPKRYIRLKVSR
jgi:hypothetical protein